MIKRPVNHLYPLVTNVIDTVAKTKEENGADCSITSDTVGGIATSSAEKIPTRFIRDPLEADDITLPTSGLRKITAVNTEPRKNEKQQSKERLAGN